MQMRLVVPSFATEAKLGQPQSRWCRQSWASPHRVSEVAISHERRTAKKGVLRENVKMKDFFSLGTLGIIARTKIADKITNPASPEYDSAHLNGQA